MYCCVATPSDTSRSRRLLSSCLHVARSGQGYDPAPAQIAIRYRQMDISRMTASNPTQEMVAFYERRTKEHIERVRRCLHVMASITGNADELNERARVHDASKFGPEERIPYVWLTEFHRCRRSGEAFTYPDGMEQRVRAAVDHHMTVNRHHPDFHTDPNDMTDVDLIEMVCDWTAMSQEFGEDGGSARGWADKTIGERLRLNDDRREFVYAMIEILDSNFDSDG